MPQTPTTPVTVFYDGSCPLCQREIGMYQRSEGNETISWCDISRPDAALQGLTAEAAMARFHVRDAKGEMQSGAKAFIALWLSLPRWRWLGRIASVAPLPWMLERMYRGFLVIRPSVQGFFRGRANESGS